VSTVQIKCIAFDLGGVLVKVNLKLLQKLNANTNLIQDAFFNKNDHHALSLGSITPDEYFASIAKQLHVKEQEVQKVWGECVTAHGFALKTLQNLTIPYVFWSNTDPVHFNTIRRQLNFNDNTLCKSMFSFSDGLLKPDSAFFRRGISKLDLPAQSILYFDDKFQNIQAAQELGIHARPISDSAQLLALLRPYLQKMTYV